jgi:hypothetical protein
MSDAFPARGTVLRARMPCTLEIHTTSTCCSRVAAASADLSTRGRRSPGERNQGESYPIIDAYAQTTLRTVFSYGLGPDTRKADQSAFGLQETVIGTHVIYPLVGARAFRGLNVSVMGEANGRFVDLKSPDPSKNVPPLATLYDEQTAPGMSTQPAFVQFGEGVPSHGRTPWGPSANPARVSTVHSRTSRVVPDQQVACSRVADVLRFTARPHRRSKRHRDRYCGITGISIITGRRFAPDDDHPKSLDKRSHVGFAHDSIVLKREALVHATEQVASRRVQIQR